MEPSTSFSSDIDMLGLDTPNGIDVMSFAMDSFIDALVAGTSQWQKFDHFLNDRPNFYEKYNSIMMELMELIPVPMLPREKSGVHATDADVLSKLFNMGNYLLIPPLVKEAKKNKPRNKERDYSCQELARDLYWLGVTHKRILQHGLQGGGPVEKDKHEGRHWRQIYGVPYDLFVPLSDRFEAWLGAKGRYTYFKHALPFRRRYMACFRQFHLGGPLHQHLEVGCL
jgi:hypothetical protein